MSRTMTVLGIAYQRLQGSQDRDVCTNTYTAQCLYRTECLIYTEPSEYKVPGVFYLRIQSQRSISKEARYTTVGVLQSETH